MIEVVIALLAGVLTGFLLRKKPFIAHMHRFTFPIVLLLLGSIGISIGLNDTLLENFLTLSWDALVITVFALAGTILCSYLLWRFILKKKIK